VNLPYRIKGGWLVALNGAGNNFRARQTLSSFKHDDMAMLTLRKMVGAVYPGIRNTTNLSDDDVIELLSRRIGFEREWLSGGIVAQSGGSGGGAGANETTNTGPDSNAATGSRVAVSAGAIKSVKPAVIVPPAIPTPSKLAPPVQPVGQGQRTIPCNLTLLRLTAPPVAVPTLKLPGLSAPKQLQGKTRIAEIRENQVPVHRCCPALLDDGGVFQITANSKANRPRTVIVEAVTEAVCSGATHPLLTASDSTGSNKKVAKQIPLSFTRPGVIADISAVPGVFVAMEAAWNAFERPTSFPLSAETCGIPAGKEGRPVSSLNGAIEVFPGDQFELEISLPAMVKPSSWRVDKKTERWETEADKDEKAAKDIEHRAGTVWDKSPALQEDQKSRDKFQERFVELKTDQQHKEFQRNLLGLQEDELFEYKDKYWEEIKFKLSQKDGSITHVAPTDDIIQLVHALVDAHYYFQLIEKWFKGLQVGPGVSFVLDCEFFVITASAKWGYKESLDDRVFWAYSGSIKMDVFKISIDINAGWKCAGLADLYLFLKGEGGISFSYEVDKEEDPDEAPKQCFKPGAEVGISGGVQGAFGWIVTGNVQLEVVFKAETEHFRLLTDKAVIDGEIVIKREPVYGSYTASCRGMGTRTGKILVIDGDEHLAQFPREEGHRHGDGDKGAE
jgi:hypothetical protein